VLLICDRRYRWGIRRPLGGRTPPNIVLRNVAHDSQIRSVEKMERETGIEPATSSLEAAFYSRNFAILR